MLTKNDLQAIGKVIDERLEQKLDERFKSYDQKLDERFKLVDEIIDKRFKFWTEYLVKEIVDLFNSTNERMDMLYGKLSSKIDKGLNKLNEHQGNINDHERRIEKLEEKVYPSTS